MTKITLVQPHLSFSAVNQFATCPRAWFSQRVLGKKQPAGEAANFGLAYEAQIIEALKATNEKGADERVDISDPQVARQIEEAKRVYLSSPGAWSADMPGKIVAQREIKITPEQWGTLADMYDAPGEIHLPMIGFIDLLHTDPTGLRRTVNDLKTTKQPGCNTSWLLQTALYALAERAQQIEIHVLLRPQERATKKPRAEDWLPKFQTAIYTYRPHDGTFKWVMGWIGYHAMKMREAEKSSLERLPACASYACAWCPESTTCEAALVSGLTPTGGTKLKEGDE